jgi:hypothetical protein
LVGKPEGKRPPKDLGIGGRKILEWILGNLVGSMDWIHLAQDGDYWLPLVNMEMSLRFP